jgi:hypothetical protein
MILKPNSLGSSSRVRTHRRSKPLRIEEAGALIRAAGQVMEVIHSVIMFLP